MRQPVTMHLGPDEVLLDLDIELRSDLSAEDTALAIEDLERTIAHELPQMTRIFVEASVFEREARETSPNESR